MREFTFSGQAAGTARTSFTSALLSGKVLSQQEELDIRWSAASLYSGASDTVSLSNLRAIYSEPLSARLSLLSTLFSLLWHCIQELQNVQGQK